MSFPSCIKIPASKISIGPAESRHDNGSANEGVCYGELISIANKVFGHGRWSHSVSNQTVDFVEYVMGKYHIGCAAFVRVQLADGTFHEDMGYSNTESSAKGSAIYTARSSSITLALKKALLCFGGAIEENINEITRKSKVRRESGRSKEERLGETTSKNRKVTEMSIEDVQCSDAVPILKDVGNTIKPVNQAQLVSTPKRIKSPLPKESEDAFSTVVTDAEVVPVDECPEPIKISVDHNCAPHKEGSSTTAMTEEDLRLERKRKQKQKQEEYKKLMKEKQMKSEDKPNPRF